MNERTSGRISVLLISLVTLSIYMENIKLFSMLGTEIKPTHVIFLAALIWAVVKSNYVLEISTNRIIMFIFFLILPLAPIYRISNMLEFLKSYVVWCICIIYLCIGFDKIYELFQEYRRRMLRFFLGTMLIIQIMAIVQFIFMNYFGIMFLTNCFGPFQCMDNYISIRNNLYRVYSVFHEPSVLGWVNTTGLAVLLYTQKENIVSTRFKIMFHVCCLLTMIVSFSSSGMYIYIAIWFSYLIINSKKARYFMAIGILICIFVFLWNFSSAMNPMKRLFTEYDNVGSSGYERLNTPIQYAISTLNNYPFWGRGIGQEGNIDAVGIIDNAIASTANNSIFQLIMNFGGSSIFIVGIFIYTFYKKIKENKDYILVLVNLIGVLISTGAYLSLDFLAVLNFSLLVFIPNKNEKEVNIYENTMDL